MRNGGCASNSCLLLRSYGSTYVRSVDGAPSCCCTLLLPLLFFPSVLTVFQCRRIDLSTGRACPGSVEGLDHDPVLGKLLEVVQGVHFAVPCSFHLYDAVLAVAAWTVFPVTDLVASDDPILQLLLWGLRRTLLPS